AAGGRVQLAAHRDVAAALHLLALGRQLQRGGEALVAAGRGGEQAARVVHREVGLAGGGGHAVVRQRDAAQELRVPGLAAVRGLQHEAAALGAEAVDQQVAAVGGVERHPVGRQGAGGHELGPVPAAVGGGPDASGGVEHPATLARHEVDDVQVVPA